MLRLPSALRDRLVAAATSRFPEEACGMMVGARRGGFGEDIREGSGEEIREDGDMVFEDFEILEVLEVLECENVAPDRRRHYEIAPYDLLEAHKRCRAEGLEILGYWHSHPTGSSRPSPVDGAHAFAGVSFVIVPVDAVAGFPSAGSLRSWEWEPERRRWREQPLEIRPSNAANPAST